MDLEAEEKSPTRRERASSKVLLFIYCYNCYVYRRWPKRRLGQKKATTSKLLDVPTEGPKYRSSGSLATLLA